MSLSLPASITLNPDGTWSRNIIPPPAPTPFLGVNDATAFTRVLCLLILSLLVLHELFHFLADGLGMGYHNVLGVMWGPGPIGLSMHVLLFLGLLWALRVAFRA